MSDSDKSVVKLSDYKSKAEEVVVDTTKLECPEYLSKCAKKHWKKIVRELGTLNIASDLDTDLIGIYCSTYARYKEHDEKITSGESQLIAKTPNGYAQLSAEYIVWEKLSDKLLKIGNKLGLNPASRASMKFMKKSDKDDLFDIE